MSPRNSSVSAKRQRSGGGTRAGASAHCASSQSSNGLTRFSGKPLSRTIWLSHSVSCKADSSRLNSAASNGHQHSALQRAGPQVGEGVGQLAQPLERCQRAAAVDHQPQRRGQLLLFLEAQRIGTVEVDEPSPGVEPGARTCRVAQIDTKRACHAAPWRANGPGHRAWHGRQPAAGRRRGVSRPGCRPCRAACAALRRRSCRPGASRLVGACKAHKRVVHLRIFGGHGAVERGDVACWARGSAQVRATM